MFKGDNIHGKELIIFRDRKNCLLQSKVGYDFVKIKMLTKCFYQKELNSILPKRTGGSGLLVTVSRYAASCHDV